MRRKYSTGVLVLLAGLIMCEAAVAQMFSQNARGRPLARGFQVGRVAQALDAPAGQIRGTERFLRGNRSGSDFVGSDMRDRTTFVGAQAVDVRTPVVSAVQDLRAAREVNLNEPARSSRGNRLYSPRLRVDFAFTPGTDAQLSARLANQLQVTETLNLLAPIAVSVADGTATLRGVAASERDREMAGLLVRLEPGVSAVRNELTVQTPTAGEQSPANSANYRPATNSR